MVSPMLHVMPDSCSTSTPHTHPPLAPETSAQAQRGASSPPLGTNFASNALEPGDCCTSSHWMFLAETILAIFVTSVQILSC